MLLCELVRLTSLAKHASTDDAAGATLSSTDGAAPFDVVMYNQGAPPPSALLCSRLTVGDADGFVTETSIANCALKLPSSDTFCTPPLSTGCLNGVGRRVAVNKDHRFKERLVHVDQVREALQVRPQQRSGRARSLIGSSRRQASESRSSRSTLREASGEGILSYDRSCAMYKSFSACPFSIVLLVRVSTCAHETDAAPTHHQWLVAPLCVPERRFAPPAVSCLRFELRRELAARWCSSPGRLAWTGQLDGRGRGSLTHPLLTRFCCI